MAAEPIHFYFDFISPYGYFAASRIDALGTRHGRAVEWRAFFMRAIATQKMGITAPLFLLPLKGDYFRQDVPRMARWFGLPFNPADIQGFNPMAAERAFWWLTDCDPALAKAFAKRVYALVFAEATAPSSIDDVVAIAAALGADGPALAEALASPELKQRLIDETEAAASHGVWGTPTVRIGDQLFWGADRLPFVEEWLARGGW
jgi:2-hydroxychromene-2-carboxylate isomerase